MAVGERRAGVTPQGLMVARMQERHANGIPAWLIAAEAERAAHAEIYGGYTVEQAKRVCPTCRIVIPVALAECDSC